MTTTTMQGTVERTGSQPTKDSSHHMPLLLAIVLVAATVVVSVFISGPLH